jgi:5-hydroxyisourate hydrolase
MSAVTTHVLDAALGRPAAGVAVQLSRAERDGWVALAEGVTDADGRLPDLGPATLAPGTYGLRFDTAAYFAATARESFYPEVTVAFTITDGGGHYHVPLLLSPFAYSTYRGS